MLLLTSKKDRLLFVEAFANISLNDRDDDRNNRIQEKLDEILSNLRPIVSASPSSHSSGTSTLDWTQSLPPLEDIHPAIENFFNRLNTKLPLFYEPTFMRIVATCYSEPAQRNHTALCATLIVVALGYAMTPSVTMLRLGKRPRDVLEKLISDIESFFLGVMSEHDDLLIVQISTAISCYFNCTGNLRKANIYIGIAMRLAFQLQLHTRPSALQLSPEDAEERIRVFWSTYLLEKASP